MGIPYHQFHVEENIEIDARNNDRASIIIYEEPNPPIVCGLYRLCITL